MSYLFHSVRWRLQLWHALILLGVIAALCVLAYRLAVEDRRKRIDRELETFERAFMRSFWELPSRNPASPSDIRERFLSLHDAKEFPLAMRDLFDPGAKDSIYLSFWDGRGQTLFRSINAPASLTFPPLPPPEQAQITRVRGDFHEVIRGGPRGFRSLVGRDISADRAALQLLGWQISVSGTLLWLLGLFGGWWLAGRAIDPINGISQTASRIAGGKLSERIDIAGTDNELSRLSQVLNETFDRLAAAIERQREFTADASHELRTPLTVILSEISRGLKRERSVAEYQEILSNCNHAAGRMRSLVESLLLLARQDETTGPARQKVDLAAVVSDVIPMLKPLTGVHGIELNLDCQSAPCWADPAAVSIVAANLISNAILHQQDGGSVWIRVFAGAQGATVEVADSGPGIAAEHLPRLFDRFYRVDPARGPSSGHSGLGLAIVRAIVDNHHGKVEVESTLGQGSTFRVIFPVES